MQQHRWWALFLCSALMLPACGKKEEKKPAKEEVKPRPTADDTKDKPREQPRPAETGKLTVAKYKALWLKLAECKLTKWGIDSKCPAYKDLTEARKSKDREQDFWKKLGPVGKELITHASPPVRYWAASSMGSFFGAKKETATFVIEKAKKETNPLVLKKMVTVVGSSAKRIPEVAAFLLATADHKEEVVRMEAVGWLASGWSRDVKGALDKVIEKIDKDPSEKVRAYACKQSFRHENDRLIPVYQKYTKNPAKLPELADGCMRGLFDMWNAFVLMEKPSQKAYKLTLALVGKKPRTDKWPPWTIMSSFGRVPKEVMPDKSKVVPKWYNQKAVIRLMVDVAKDKAYNWLGRSGAVAALGQLGAVKDLEKIKKALTGAKDDNNKSHVLRKIDSVMAKAKSAATKGAAAPPPKGKPKGMVKGKAKGK